MARISRTGTTDSTGVASTTVTGSGGGRLKFISRNGGLWSNSYEIEDLIFYDTATSNQKESMYFKGNCTQSFSDDGSTLTPTSDTYYAQVFFGQSTNARNIFSDGMCFECDITGLTGSFNMGIISSTSNSAYPVANGTHFKITIKDETVTFYRDDTVTKTVALSTITSDKYSFFATVRGTANRVTFKNVKIYPVFSAPKHYTPIALSSSASVIQTGESATLSAELTNVLGEKLAQKSVNFIEKSQQIATATTNSQGVATTTITSNGTGERQFIAKADNVESEPITITDNDYIYYHEEEITSNTSTDNYKVIKTLSELPSQFELTFDYKTNGESRVGLFSSNNFSGNPNYSVFVGSPNGSNSKYYGIRTTATNTYEISGSPTDYHSYLIRRNGNTFYFQIDDGAVYSLLADWFDNYTYVIGLMGWGTDKTSSVKNILLRSI